MNKRKRKKMWAKLTAASLAEKGDYDAGGSCICFCCGRRFPVSDMSEDDWLEEPDGRLTALCPYCAMDTVLPDTGDIPESWVTAARQYDFGKKERMFR